jgi:hypothetical protein
MGNGSNLKLSCYLTLTLAAVCLGFADMYFLTWIPWCLAIVMGAFALAWRNEGRRYLSEPAANTLGLLIAFGMLWWIIFQLPHSEEELSAAGVPWPAGLLPHLGPLLMILTAVKLFRPKKVADFWGLQILGIMMVTLASVLAGELEHGVWAFLYLVCALWCLADFYGRKSSLANASVRSEEEGSLFAGEAGTRLSGTEGWRRRAWSATRWSFAIAGLGGAIFLVLPRHGGVQWVPHKLTTTTNSRQLTGFDAGMDLNRTGKVELSDMIAFEVNAIDSSGRAASLPESIYWRGETLEFYRNGRWQTSSLSYEVLPDFLEELADPNDALRQVSLWTPEVLGSRQPRIRPEGLPAHCDYLSIRALPSLGGNLVLAEPIDIEAGVGLMPHIGERESRSGLFAYLEGTDTIQAQGRRATHTYGQVIDPKASMTTQPARRIQTRYLQTMLAQKPVAEMVDLSKQLLARIGGLKDTERILDERGNVPPEHRVRVAQALARHFSSSGEYLYTLNRRRVDPTVDPNVDFLRNVKEGHCERYASGLALTLRSLGIPCRIVRGFRGYEVGEDDVTRVRLNQAHSWVQALTPRAAEPGYDWLLLDPTPSQEAAQDRWQIVSDWCNEILRSARTAFRINVLEYNSEQQGANLQLWWEALHDNLSTALSIAGTAFFLGGAAVAWRRRRSLQDWSIRWTARRRKSRTPWLDEALTLIAKRSGRTLAAQETLREFAAALPEPELAEPFAVLVEQAQSVQFGGHVLAETDRAAIAASLMRLQSP